MKPLRKRPGPPRRLVLVVGVLMVVAGLVGGLLSGVWMLELLLTQPVALLASTALATLTAVPYSLAILWLDRNEREPPGLVVGAWMWGAAAATAWSALANLGSMALWLHATGDPAIAEWITASVNAPIVEEATKALALLGLFSVFRQEADNVLDGIVYGALVGMGFAWFENITYYVAAWDHGATTLLEVTWARGVVSGVGSHATFTALTGLGFGLFRVSRRGGFRMVFPAMGLLAAMGAHGLWNMLAGAFIHAAGDVLWVGTPVAVAALQLPFVTLVGLVLIAAWRHETALIRTWLLQEPDDVVRPHDVEILVPARRRLRGELAVLLEDGPRAWWLSRRLSRALVRLAFERWHHDGDEHPWTPRQDAEIRRWRQEVRDLRGRGARLA